MEEIGAPFGPDVERTAISIARLRVASEVFYYECYTYQTITKEQYQVWDRLYKEVFWKLKKRLETQVAWVKRYNKAGVESKVPEEPSE